MALDLGLNVYQILQTNCLSVRRTGATVVLYSFRQRQGAARQRRSNLTQRPSLETYHGIHKVSALVGEQKEHRDHEKQTGKARKSLDPTQNRSEEIWEVARGCPRTVGEFSMLRASPEKLRNLLELYDVKVYAVDGLRGARCVDLDNLRDVMARASQPNLSSYPPG